MSSPIHRTSTQEDANRYRLEPYAVAGDVYTVGADRGRGGWSWYTGAAAWTWRLGVEGLLGLRMHDGRIKIRPALPEGWPGYSARLVRGGGTIDLTVEVCENIADPVLDVGGRAIEGFELSFPEHGGVVTAILRIPLGPPTSSPEGRSPNGRRWSEIF